jgi:hypothetical protein
MLTLQFRKSFLSPSSVLKLLILYPSKVLNLYAVYYYVFPTNMTDEFRCLKLIFYGLFYGAFNMETTQRRTAG